MNIIDVDQFYTEVEEKVWMTDCTYIDAVVTVCKEREIEIETVAEMIEQNQRLKLAIEEEGEALRILKKSVRLKFDT